MTSQIKTALITGASRRIGRSIALLLADDGWDIAIHYNRSSAEADELCGIIEAKRRRAVTLQADLANSAELATVIPRASEALGPLSLVINNASLFEPDHIGDVDEDSWSGHLDTNLKAPVFLTRDFAAQIPNGETGSLINIIDQRVLKLRPDYLSYTLSKAALWTFTQTSAMALAPAIRVNAISPGPTLANARQDDEQFRQQCETTPLKRGPEPEEIAAAVKFILAAPSMTGEMITLDGGQHLPSYPLKADEGVLNNDRALPPRPPAKQNGKPGIHKIFIRDLLVNMYIGVYEVEKNNRQDVRFNIDMVVDDPTEPLDDEYLQVVCYETISIAVKALCQSDHINLVETLAEKVAELCLSNSRVAHVVVKVEKLQAVKNAGAVGVEIERNRP